MKPGKISAALACGLLASCTSLLPRTIQNSDTPWTSYSEAETAFNAIEIEKTTLDQLHEMGLNPSKTPNITKLSHADLMRRLALTGGGDPRWMAPQIQRCVAEQLACFAYEVEQRSTLRKRDGNFWLDFLGFKRNTTISGWYFDAIFIIQQDKVVYKLWSGTPSIEQFEKDTTPLGPFQRFDPSVFGL
ncbi:hypothetical protein [Chitinibacter sp. S2-10]|uniref:hypothetical protein n=1 Tax=Chitinibacter sp. S2-10 TaxID=3373597 RepID=UPI0039774015